jgi:hypothetical protein
MVADFVILLALSLFIDFVSVDRMLVVLTQSFEVSEEWTYRDTLGFRHALIIVACAGLTAAKYYWQNDLRLVLAFGSVFLVGHFLAYLKLAKKGLIKRY